MGEPVGIRALQQHASAVVARAAAGEIVEITDRGRPVAQLMPLGQSRLAALVAAGLAQPARRRLAHLPAPASPAVDGPTPGQLLADARSSER